jgi:hypothetical protein
VQEIDWSGSIPFDPKSVITDKLEELVTQEPKMLALCL